MKRIYIVTKIEIRSLMFQNNWYIADINSRKMKMTVEYTNFAESKDVITFINPKLEKKSTLGKCFIFSQEKFFLYFGKIELLYYRKLLNPKLKKIRKILHRKFFLYFLSEKKLNKTFLYF